MDFEYPADVADFRREFGKYLDSLATPELREEIATGGGESTGPLVRALWRRLGQEGYFGLGWPAEYGGGGKSIFYHHAFNYEMEYRRLPVPVVTLNTVAPTLMRIGSDEQKREFLPKILRAEVEFAIGYTEPQAGTDLASLDTRAVRDGDTYVVNGQKVFTTGAHQADYLWLAVRTDPEAPKHRGISLLIAPLRAEGVDVRPFPVMHGGRTNIVFLDNVRVPVSGLVGEENRGWYYMTMQLDFERVAISPVPAIERVFDSLCAYVREQGIDGERSWTRVALASMAADLNMLKVLDLKALCMIDSGEIPVAEASALKVLSNELRVTLLTQALQILGPRGINRRGSPDAFLDLAGDTFERQLRESPVTLFGGGSNDIQRDIIATHGLGLSR